MCDGLKPSCKMLGLSWSVYDVRYVHMFTLIIFHPFANSIILHQLTNLHSRDGMEFIMVCVRSSARHLSKTVTFLTPAGKAFLTAVTKVQPLTWVNQFEAFAINGISGLSLIYL